VTKKNKNNEIESFGGSNSGQTWVGGEQPMACVAAHQRPLPMPRLICHLQDWDTPESNIASIAIYKA